MTDTKKPGFGILSVSPELLVSVLCLPEGYRVASMDFNVRGELDLLLQSDALPEVPPDQNIPQVRLWATVHRLPDQPPEYRYITTEIQL